MAVNISEKFRNRKSSSHICCRHHLLLLLLLTANVLVMLGSGVLIQKGHLQSSAGSVWLQKVSPVVLFPALQRTVCKKVL